MERPKISIITVVWNGKKHIEDTIKSVIGQTYPNLEYIVIDGASTDGTTDIIERYAPHITYWVSERDSGIYDAMNKGVKAATGDWLLFVNADDYLASSEAIGLSADYLGRCSSLVAYGNVIFLTDDGEEKHGHPWEKIRYEFRNIGMRLPHQATFHAKALFANRTFDPSYRITGDYDLLLGYLKDHDAVHFPVEVTKMRAGGISDSVSKLKLFKETRRAQLSNGVYKVPSLHWYRNAAKVIAISWVIRFLGKDFKNRIKSLVK